MKNRIAIGALALSAVGFVGIVSHESYTGSAIEPLPGDRPTYGLGSTFRPDGSPVKMGDKITPPAAIALSARQIEVKEVALKRCLPVKLYQHEYDAYVSLAYNVGPGAICNSSIPGKLIAEDYAGACAAILSFDKFRDPTKPKVQNPKTGKWEHPLVKIRGLTLRREDEYRQCMGGA